MNISVVIPSFNRKNTLSRSIDSVLKQTYKPSEIILVDDGSTDGTRGFILSSYPNIKYFFQPKKGVSSARNKGILESSSEWIAFLDSDDEWMPQKLEKQKKQLEKHSGIFISHTNEIWIRNGVRVNQMKKHQKYGGYIFDKCLDICRMSPSSVLIHKRVISDIGVFDETLQVCEDYDLWLRITSKYSVLFEKELLIIKYGGHKDQLSKVKEGIEQFRIQSLEKILTTNYLTKDQFTTTKNMLIRKLSIYSKGLEKRNKFDELALVKKKILNWTITQ
ncbi:glycosyltransferase family 2 protein [Candidatus Marinimicrobia bacterium]|jgi:glycosyltransferase involved in cell wall biosynthesis|nr:glycosyltransferase family 2 protein [Candidatus Neomarinimicrobiota bacterium]MDC0630523.1 glycosyltransferase family 2 protein [Candidatus Neomarinimicrobiota bacterium]